MAKVLKPHLTKNFDDPFDPVPIGKYIAQITESDYVETRASKESGAKNCYFEAYTFTIIEGKYKGRKTFEKYNTTNTNENTEQWANEKTARLARILGCEDYTDTEQLHYKPLVTALGIIPANDKYPAQNKVTAFYSIDEAGADLSSPASQTPQVSPGASWGKTVEKAPKQTQAEISSTLTKEEPISKDWDKNTPDEDIPFD